ncbi:MAG: DUF4367 domain-containing protein [Candidatus Methanoperedens sp.]|nr:DUF4367 domain-containing protein [Candidatus Methanoperedens sp.]
MKKSILMGVSITTVAAILLGAFALGFAGNDTKLNEFVDAQVNEQVMEKAIEVTSNPTPAPAKEKTPDEAIAEAQAKVSFTILQPSYVPEKYALNIPQVSGTRFRGVAVELEQAMLPYTNGKETLNLKELLIINDTTLDPHNTAIPEDTREIVDINGINGRYAEETNGVKILNWKIGELSLTISSLTYDSNSIAGSSLSREEIIKMARSVK